MAGSALLVPPFLSNRAGAAGREATAGRSIEAVEFQTVFFDNFEGGRLNPEHWNVGTPWGGQFDQSHELFVPEAVQVNDGHLKLYWWQLDQPVQVGSKTRTHATGMVNTKNKVIIQPGDHVQISMNAEGAPGIWPIAWILPNDWPKNDGFAHEYEIDIFEPATLITPDGRAVARGHQTTHIRNPQDPRQMIFGHHTREGNYSGYQMPTLVWVKHDDGSSHTELFLHPHPEPTFVSGTIPAGVPSGALYFNNFVGPVDNWVGQPDPNIRWGQTMIDWVRVVRPVR